MSEIRLTWTFLQPVFAGVSSAYTNFLVTSALTGGYPPARSTLLINQPLTGGYSSVRLDEMFCQALFPVEPEPVMAEEAFPGFGNSTTDPTIPAAKNPAGTNLPGLTYSVHKKPEFSTRIGTSASGREIRNAMYDMPIWEFEWSYEFLEDRSGAESSLKTLMGFFLECRGSAVKFLVKDPDDYLVDMGLLGVADGVTTQFYFRRTMGRFSEIVGQVDLDNDINLYYGVTEEHGIPSTPYKVTVDHGADFHRSISVTKDGDIWAKVSGAPGLNQYSVNDVTGEYTFNAGNIAQDVVITYAYDVDPADYTVTMPNKVVFDSAPDEANIFADFQFFFVCRFLDDAQDFEKFMDQLWSLRSLSFKSVLQ